MASQIQIDPPGQMVDVGGFKLHAIVQGQGSPVVVLEPGLGGFALQYAHIQQAVGEFTRVVAYDRAGQAWSDLSPNTRTPANLAMELTTLLEKLDLQPPYVLVGHSLGGLLVRLYAGFHPQETAGVILVDSSDVEQYAAFPDLDKMVGQMAFGVRLMKFLSKVGLGKPLTKLSMGSMAKTLPAEDLKTFVDIASQPKHNEATLAEYTQHRSYFGPRAEVPLSMGDLPLTIITAEKSVSGKGKVPGGMTIDQVNALHQRLQSETVKISTHSEHIVIPGASHLSVLTHPEHTALVVDAIRRMVERVRDRFGVGVEDSRPA